MAIGRADGHRLGALTLMTGPSCRQADAPSITAAPQQTACVRHWRFALPDVRCRIVGFDVRDFFGAIVTAQNVKLAIKDRRRAVSLGRWASTPAERQALETGS